MGGWGALGMPMTLCCGGIAGWMLRSPPDPDVRAAQLLEQVRHRAADAARDDGGTNWSRTDAPRAQPEPRIDSQPQPTQSGESRASESSAATGAQPRSRRPSVTIPAYRFAGADPPTDIDLSLFPIRLASSTLAPTARDVLAAERAYGTKLHLQYAADEVKRYHSHVFEINKGWEEFDFRFAELCGNGSFFGSGALFAAGRQGMAAADPETTLQYFERVHHQALSSEVRAPLLVKLGDFELKRLTVARKIAARLARGAHGIPQTDIAGCYMSQGRIWTVQRGALPRIDELYERSQNALAKAKQEVGELLANEPAFVRQGQSK